MDDDRTIFVDMEEDNTSVTDLDPVSEQLVTGAGGNKRKRFSAGPLLSWGILLVALIAAFWMGVSEGTNPTDQTVACLAAVPLALLGVAVWALLVALFRRASGLSIQRPIVLSAGLVALWMWAQYLAQFDVMYRLEPTGPLSGIYVVRWGIAFLLGCIALLSLIAAVFTTLTLARELACESVPIAPVVPPTDGEQNVVTDADDTVLESDESIYEAQVLLLNLGYEIVQVDGQLDDMTRSALKKVQMTLGLPPSGDLTTLTLEDLRHRANLQVTPSLRQIVKVVLAHIGRCVRDGLRLRWQRRYAG